MQDIEQPVKTKSQLKREMDDLQKLGERLLALNSQQLAKLDLPSDLLDAVLLAKRISAHGGKRRQLQYIGKLMRHIDPQPLQSFFAELDQQSYGQTAALHQLEGWRERLVADTTNESLTLYIQQFPLTEAQHLRQLIQAAKKERLSDKNTGASRKLFQYLRTTYQ
jgi:ribosome-associated protein